MHGLTLKSWREGSIANVGRKHTPSRYIDIVNAASRLISFDFIGFWSLLQPQVTGAVHQNADVPPSGRLRQ